MQGRVSSGVLKPYNVRSCTTQREYYLYFSTSNERISYLWDPLDPHTPLPSHGVEGPNIKYASDESTIDETAISVYLAQ